MRDRSEERVAPTSALLGVVLLIKDGTHSPTGPGMLCQLNT